jgi:starch synthase
VAHRRILFLIAEAAPLIKVGGLADVAQALPRELRALGHDVRVVLPLHPPLRELVGDDQPIATFQISARAGLQDARVYAKPVERDVIYLVDGPPLRAADAPYHSRPEEDAPKFVFFSRAALELARALGWKPDVVHANDWHAAAAIYWLQTKGKSDPFFAETGALITVHNLPYLGDNAGDALREYDLIPDDEPLLPDWARDAILPLALARADIITTVSPTYAAEIRTAQFGCGLEELLQARADRLRGILNGLDARRWDPARDAALAARFDVNRLERRRHNKAALQEELELKPQPDVPLVGVVSRLVHQKGCDIAAPALAQWAERGNQFVVLGRGDESLENQFRELSERFPDRAAAAIRFNAGLASRIYAGADMFLMPSRYEPCGLSQMIAMRYGCIPSVHAVGGLRDTVRDVADARGTGFVFSDDTAAAITDALNRAAALYAQPRRWQALQRRAMRQHFSWKKSARAYLAAYRQAMVWHRAARKETT